MEMKTGTTRWVTVTAEGSKHFGKTGRVTSDWMGRVVVVAFADRLDRMFTPDEFREADEREADFARRVTFVANLGYAEPEAMVLAEIERYAYAMTQARS